MVKDLHYSSSVREENGPDAMGWRDASSTPAVSKHRLALRYLLRRQVGRRLHADDLPGVADLPAREHPGHPPLIPASTGRSRWRCRHCGRCRTKETSTASSGCCRRWRSALSPGGFAPRRLERREPPGVQAMWPAAARRGPPSPLNQREVTRRRPPVPADRLQARRLSRGRTPLRHGTGATRATQRRTSRSARAAGRCHATESASAGRA